MDEADIDINEIIKEFRRKKNKEIFQNNLIINRSWIHECRAYNVDIKTYIIIGYTLYRII